MMSIQIHVQQRQNNCLNSNHKAAALLQHLSDYCISPGGGLTPLQGLALPSGPGFWVLEEGRSVGLKMFEGLAKFWIQALG